MELICNGNQHDNCKIFYIFFFYDSDISKSPTDLKISPILARFPLLCQSIKTSITGMACPKNFQRLPKNVVPKHYKLKLTPDLEKFTFEGSEDITVEVSYFQKQKSEANNFCEI